MKPHKHNVKMNQKTLIFILLLAFIFCGCFFSNNENYKASTISDSWPKTIEDQWGENISWIKNNEGKWKMKLNQTNPVGSY